MFLRTVGKYGTRRLNPGQNGSSSLLFNDDDLAVKMVNPIIRQILQSTEFSCTVRRQANVFVCYSTYYVNFFPKPSFTQATVKHCDKSSLLWKVLFEQAKLLSSIEKEKKKRFPYIKSV